MSPRTTGNRRSELVRLYLKNFGRKAPDLLCPEIIAWNTLDYQGLWRAALALDPGAAVPFWGVVWPGGRALARYILDNRKKFKGRTVLDTGCGSGITSVAAAMAGARVTAMDIDPHAVELGRETMKANRVKVDFAAGDPYSLDPADCARYDLVLAGDLFYEEKVSRAVVEFLRAAASRGIPNIYSDSGRSFAPAGGYTHITTIRTPQYRELDNIAERDVMVRSLTA